MGYPGRWPAPEMHHDFDVLAASLPVMPTLAHAAQYRMLYDFRCALSRPRLSSETRPCSPPPSSTSSSSTKPLHGLFTLAPFATCYAICLASDLISISQMLPARRNITQ